MAIEKTLLLTLRGKDELSPALNGAAASADKLTGIFGTLKSAVGAYLGIQAVAGAARFIRDRSIEEGRLAEALSMRGEAEGFTVRAMKDSARAIGDITSQGTLAIEKNLALALSIGATTDQAKKIVLAADRMSDVFGTELSGNVEKLTKTLTGTAGQLGKLIPGFKELTEEELKAGKGIDFITERLKKLEESGARQTIETLEKGWENIRESLYQVAVLQGRVLSNATGIDAKGILSSGVENLGALSKYLADINNATDEQRAEAQRRADARTAPGEINISGRKYREELMKIMEEGRFADRAAQAQRERDQSAENARRAAGSRALAGGFANLSGAISGPGFGEAPLMEALRRGVAMGAGAASRFGRFMGAFGVDEGGPTVDQIFAHEASMNYSQKVREKVDDYLANRTAQRMVGLGAAPTGDYNRFLTGVGSEQRPEIRYAKDTAENTKLTAERIQQLIDEVKTQGFIKVGLN